MNIITLTSDLGTKSQYAAVLQGVIYTLLPSAKIVEITHQVPNFDIMEAAYIVKNTYHAFPEGTVHLIAVDPEFGENGTGIVMKMQEHYFVAPDNGICSLIAEEQEAQCVKIEHLTDLKEKYPKSFRVGGVLAPTAALLASGMEMKELGNEHKMKTLLWGEPTQAQNCLRGKIIHIDKFGNAITNISKSSFLKVKQEMSFEIFIRSVRLKRVVSTYSDVGKADALAIFGESGQLEIAMREASAADLLGLKIHDMITVEFK